VPSATPRVNNAGQAAIHRGVTYLSRTQHPTGNWTDFWLPVGTSDAWVTAYAGLALAEVAATSRAHETTKRLAHARAFQASDWLLAHQHPRGGWGYNATVDADADSTAHALSLIARLGKAPPTAAVHRLLTHHAAGGLYRTYAWQDERHAWTQPTADVTAAVLRAFHDLGHMNAAALRDAWTSALAPLQRQDGSWPGFWWTNPSYATGLVLEVWRAAGRPDLTHPLRVHRPSGAFDLAWHTLALATVGEHEAASESACSLLAMQSEDGAWASSDMLLVPPARTGSVIKSHDARRVFTTASVLRALVRPETLAPRCGPRTVTFPANHRAGRREPLVHFVMSAARNAGIQTERIARTTRLFRVLTRESLRVPETWPSRQLTALSGGVPVEFSTVVGPNAPAGLRYAVEIAPPERPPAARASAAVRVLERAALHLGYEPAWQRVNPALRSLAAHFEHAPNGLRFVMWGGVDQHAPRACDASPPAVLKAYVNLLHHELGNGRARLETALRQASVPVTPELRIILDVLDQHGFPHEVGFACGSEGRVACKIYYDVRGWSRRVMQTLLDATALPGTLEDLCPAIPGVLHEHLASKSRAGIGLRVNCSTGAATELMAASAFPIPLVPLGDTCERVEAWLTARVGSAEPYRSLSAALRPGWPDDRPDTRDMHSLLTRAVTLDGPKTTIYMRPWLHRFANASPRLPHTDGRLTGIAANAPRPPREPDATMSIE